MDMKFKFLLILPLLVAFLQADSVEGSLPNPGPIQVRSNPLAHFSANGIGADADKFRNNADTNSLLTVVNSGRIASHVAEGNGSVRVWSYDEEYTLSELYNITSPHSTPNNDSFGYEIELNGEFLGVGSYYAMESATHAGRYYVYNASTGSLNSDFNYSPQTAQYFGIDSSLGDNFLCVLESGNLGWNTEGGISLYSLDYATNAVSFVEHLSFRYLKPSGYGIYSGALASSDRDLITVQRIEGNEAKLLSAYRIEYQSGEPSGIGLLDSKALPLDFFSYRRDVIDFSGSFAVVSDPFFDDSGRVLVYPFGSQEGFGEGIEIQETNPTSSARFGQSVRLYESDILFVSSPYHATEGCVYIYDISSISSVQLICVLWPPESSGLTQFGSNLYIDGNKLAVSSGANDLLLYDINSLLDHDNDGLLNSVETNTGINQSSTDTGTDPNNADSDLDGVPDGVEVKEGTDPNDAGSFNSFSTGLSAYFPFNGNANDESGNGIDGAINGATLTSNRFGEVGGAYRFDGDDYIDFGDEIDIGDNELTISVWVKHSSNDGEKTFISKGQSTHSIPAESGYLLMVDNGKYIVRYHDDQGRGLDVSANIENLNYWTQLVYRLSRQGDSATLTLFINGELVASSTGQVGSSNSQSNLSFGYHSKPINAHGFIVGEVDDVRIYNRALSGTEVFDLFYSETPQFQITEGSFTWQEAKADAEARGGRLAVLNTQEKIDAANEYLLRIGEWPHTWIGLTDEVETDSWVWLDGSKLSVSNWGGSEPNNSWENYAGIWDSENTPPTWADYSSTHISGAYLYEMLFSPVLDLETFYESNSHESMTIDATPTDGYPTSYTYQWSFKAAGNNSYFVIPSNFGGTATSYQISGNSGNNGTWKVEVSNNTGTTTAEFDYRVYADSDNDGLSDGQEEFILGTDPNDNDSDDDTLLDGAETNTGTWVSASDTGTDPLSNDSDSDGLNDGVETNTAEYIDATDTGTDPNDSDTDNDGLLDGAETNTNVYVSSSDTGTHPLNTDSDADGYSDYVETNTGNWTSSDDTGTDPNRVDTDNDGIIDGRETNTGAFVSLTDTGTDPNNTDSDGDGFTDIYEINTSYDPTNSEDTPDAVLVIKTAIELEFHGASGGTYRIEHSTDLGSWTTVEDNIQGESALVERLHSIDDYNRRFFRVIRTNQ